MLLTLVIVSLSMLVKDALGTFMVVAEAKGRALMAGALDAGGDLANTVCYAVGAGEIIVHGWNGKAIAILTTMMATSLIGTTAWTKLGQRIKAHDHDRASA